MNDERWRPYVLGVAPRLRPLSSIEGLIDRLRFVAFAERQATLAFADAAERFHDVPAGLKEAWRWVSQEERKHEGWLIQRLHELGGRVEDVPVTINLYRSFDQCHSALAFAHYMADAEERGRVAGIRFGEVLQQRDKVTAEIFAQIAREEEEHVALVKKYFSEI